MVKLVISLVFLSPRCCLTPSHHTSSDCLCSLCFNYVIVFGGQFLAATQNTVCRRTKTQLVSYKKARVSFLTDITTSKLYNTLCQHIFDSKVSPRTSYTAKLPTCPCNNAHGVCNYVVAPPPSDHSRQLRSFSASTLALRNVTPMSRRSRFYCFSCSMTHTYRTFSIHTRFCVISEGPCNHAICTLLCISSVFAYC